MDDVRTAAFIAIVALVILVCFLVAWAGGFLPELRSRRFKGSYQSSRFDIKDVGQQLQTVMAASFQRQRLLNHSEYQVFKIIEDDITAARNGYRVFAQTSLGEVLESSNANAFRSINSKRVDILIVDWGGWPVVAVEYQGKGHYQGTAAARDAVKKEALRKAGVRYIEVSETDSAEQIRVRVREQLGLNTAARADAPSVATIPSSFGLR